MVDSFQAGGNTRDMARPDNGGIGRELAQRDGRESDGLLTDKLRTAIGIAPVTTTAPLPVTTTAPALTQPTGLMFTPTPITAPSAAQATTPAPTTATAAAPAPAFSSGFEPMSGPAAGAAFVPKDASVSTQLENVLASDSPLLTRARTGAKQAANRRGLLNSSMAVQAGEAAALDVALPIASQTAAQIAQSNLQGGQIAATDRLTSEQIAAQERLLGGQLTSAEGLQAQQIAAQEDLQARQLASSEGLGYADIASREAVSQAGITAQQRIAASQLASFDKEKATAAVAQVDATYQNAFASIMANPELPADARDAALLHLAAIRDTGFNLTEQLYNIDLVWTSAVTPPPAA